MSASGGGVISGLRTFGGDALEAGFDVSQPQRTACASARRITAWTCRTLAGASWPRVDSSP